MGAVNKAATKRKEDHERAGHMRTSNSSMHHRARWFSKVLLTPLILAGLASAPALATPTGKMGPTTAPTPQDVAAPNAALMVAGKRVALKSYMGHPLVVWQVTTWCPSCKAGLKVFARHQAQIDKSDMTVLVLRDYRNGGYPGPGMHKFVEQTAPKLLNDPHFVFGNDTKTLFDLYNPHKFVDVYQVIAPDRHIAVVSSTPSVTFGKIEHFIKPKNGA